MVIQIDRFVFSLAVEREHLSLAKLPLLDININKTEKEWAGFLREKAEDSGMGTRRPRLC